MRQRLGHLREQHRPQFRAAEKARLQHAEEAAVDQRRHHVLRQFAPPLDLVAGFLQQRRQVAGALDEVDVAHVRLPVGRTCIGLRPPSRHAPARSSVSSIAATRAPAAASAARSGGRTLRQIASPVIAASAAFSSGMPSIGSHACSIAAWAPAIVEQAAQQRRHQIGHAADRALSAGGKRTRDQHLGAHQRGDVRCRGAERQERREVAAAVLHAGHRRAVARAQPSEHRRGHRHAAHLRDVVQAGLRAIVAPVATSAAT